MKKKKILFFSLLGLGAVFVLMEIAAIIMAWPQRLLVETSAQKTGTRVESETASLWRRINALAPKGIFIVVDSARNTLYLKQGRKIIRQVVISCGSGSILEEPGGKRKWIFDTPHGEFQVKSKLVDPTWVKPDWAFIEEGKEVPKNPEERLEAGVLGDYALGFGDGYFIHGTLYSRLLGRSVTHGCIRVGDGDLKALFQAASVGTNIYIF